MGMLLRDLALDKGRLGGDGTAGDEGQSSKDRDNNWSLHGCSVDIVRSSIT